MMNSKNREVSIRSGFVLLLVIVLVASTACNRRSRQMVRPAYVGLNNPSFVQIEFPKEKKLEAVQMHIDNRKMRIWNSQYLPYGTKVDSVYLNMGISNQLKVTLYNETTGKRVENWDSGARKKIDLTGGKLLITIEKSESPTLTYQLRLMTYGYDPSHLSWELHQERLPVKSDDAIVLARGEERFWLTKVPVGAGLKLFRIASVKPFAFEEVQTAQVPSGLQPRSILKDHEGCFWGLTNNDELYYSRDLIDWQKKDLGSVRLTMLISDSESDDELPLITAIGYEVAQPNRFFTFSIEEGGVEKGTPLETDFPVREAYVYTYNVAGSTHSYIFSGFASNGKPATASFFTSDGVNWGKVPYGNAGTETLPVSRGLFLNPYNNKGLFVVGGLNSQGETVNKILVSHNRGNTWQELTKELAPDKDFRGRYGASGIITEYVGGMPQFYIFGGNIDGAPTDEIWHGWLDTRGGIINSFEE